MHHHWGKIAHSSSERSYSHRSQSTWYPLLSLGCSAYEIKTVRGISSHSQEENYVLLKHRAPKSSFLNHLQPSSSKCLLQWFSHQLSWDDLDVKVWWSRVATLTSVWYDPSQSQVCCFGSNALARIGWTMPSSSQWSFAVHPSLSKPSAIAHLTLHYCASHSHFQSAHVSSTPWSSLSTSHFPAFDSPARSDRQELPNFWARTVSRACPIPCDSPSSMPLSEVSLCVRDRHGVSQCRLPVKVTSSGW